MAIANGYCDEHQDDVIIKIKRLTVDVAMQVRVVMVGGGRNIRGHFYADQKINSALSGCQGVLLLPNVLTI